MKVHLITRGDSLGLTTMGTACGLDGDDIPHGDSGYFGDGYTLRKVTCQKCKASKEFREEWATAFPDEPHPFKAAAQAAVETRKINAAMKDAKTTAAVEHILGLPWRARSCVVQRLYEKHRDLLVENR